MIARKNLKESTKVEKQMPYTINKMIKNNSINIKLIKSLSNKLTKGVPLGPKGKTSSSLFEFFSLKRPF
jgi:hypothetical protein